MITFFVLCFHLRINEFQAISPRAALERSLTQLVPPTELMHGACLRYGKSSSEIAPIRKSATSARLMEPAYETERKEQGSTGRKGEGVEGRGGLECHCQRTIYPGTTLAAEGQALVGTC